VQGLAVGRQQPAVSSQRSAVSSQSPAVRGVPAVVGNVVDSGPEGPAKILWSRMLSYTTTATARLRPRAGRMDRFEYPFGPVDGWGMPYYWFKPFRLHCQPQCSCPPSLEWWLDTARGQQHRAVSLFPGNPQKVRLPAWLFSVSPPTRLDHDVASRRSPVHPSCAALCPSSTGSCLLPFVSSFFVVLPAVFYPSSIPL